MNIVEIANGYAELKEDGTWVRHPFKFVQAGQDIVRLTYDDAGRVASKEFYEPHDLVTVDAQTGKVLQAQSGFVLEHEIRAPEHPEPGKRYVQVRRSEMPPDLFARRGEARAAAYRWDDTARGLVPRDAAEIDAELTAQDEARAAAAAAAAAARAAREAPAPERAPE